MAESAKTCRSREPQKTNLLEKNFGSSLIFVNSGEMMVLVKLGASSAFHTIFISLGISLLMLPINVFAKEPGIDSLFEVQLGTNLAVTKKEIIRDNEKQFMTEFRIPSPSSYPGSLFDSLKVIVNGKGKVASISSEAALKDTQTCNMHRNAIYDWMQKQYGIDGKPKEYIYQFEASGRLRLAGARCHVAADLSETMLEVNVIDRTLIEQIEHSYANRKVKDHK